MQTATEKGAEARGWSELFSRATVVFPHSYGTDHQTCLFSIVEGQHHIHSLGLEAAGSRYFCATGFHLLNLDNSTDVKRNAFKTARCSGKSCNADKKSDFYFL